MKKQTFTLLLCCIALTTQASIQRTVSLGSADVRVGETTINGTMRSTISADGWIQTADASDYLLPAKYLSFSVPCYAENISVSVNSVTSSYNIDLAHPLAQETYATACNNPDGGAIMDPGKVPYPAFGLVDIESIGYKGGCHKIVTVRITPAKFNSLTNKVTIYGPITFTVNWNFAAPTTESISPIFSNSLSYNNNAINSVKKIVENPQEVLQNAVAVPMSLTTDQEDWPYIIITPAKFAKSMRRLAAIRQARGYGAEVFTIESILNDSRFADGDSLTVKRSADGSYSTPSTDNASKLRVFLRHALKSYGTQSVLFAGDASVIPIRYGASDDMTDVTTDMYYSDLNNKWKKSGDNYTPSLTDYHRDLNIGRIPFESDEDITNYISKIINYEFNPGLGDSEYLNKMFLTRQDTLLQWNRFTDESLSDLFEVYGISDIINYAETSYHQGIPSGAQIASALTANPCGFHQFIGHGNPGGVGVSTTPDCGYYGLVAYDDYDAGHRVESGNGLDCINADRYPGWSYSMSCSLMPFDNKHKGALKRTFGTAYLLEKNFGGVAFMGNTSESASKDGENMMVYLCKRLKEIDTAVAKRPIEAGELMEDLRGNAMGIKKRERLMHNLYGDPAAILWIKQPNKIQYIETASDSIGRYYQFAGNLPDTITIAIRELRDRTYASMIVMPSSQLPSYRFVDGCEYSILGDKMLPVILPLKLTNIGFPSYNPYYLYAHDVSISYNPLASASDFYYEGAHFGTGSDVTIEANNIEITEALKLSSGSKLTVIAHGLAHLEDITVPSGATLIVNADSLDIEKGTFYFSPGCTVIINGEDWSDRYHSRRRITNVKTMTVEGRTWWYELGGMNDEEASTFVRGEIGLTISGTKEIDGNTWHLIKMRMGADVILANNEIIQKYNSDKPIALIRQNGNDVYVMADESCSRELDCLFNSENPPIIYSRPTMICRFGELADILTIYDTDEFPITYKIIDKIYGTEDKPISSVCEIVGDHFNKHQRFTISEGLGLTSRGNVTDPGLSELFFAPFSYALSGIHKYGIPQLRYVTDGDENAVIYTAKGGYRLWDHYTGVERVVADGDGGDAVDVLYYNLQGQPVSDPQPGGMYIRVDGGRATKVIAK